MDEPKSNHPSLHPFEEQFADQTAHGDVQFPQLDHTKHRWTQRGHTIHCDSIHCVAEHGLHLSPDEIMVGVGDDGLPIIEPRHVAQPEKVFQRKAKP